MKGGESEREGEEERERVRDGERERVIDGERERERGTEGGRGMYRERKRLK